MALYYFSLISFCSVFPLFFFVYSAGKILTKGMVKSDRTQLQYREGKLLSKSKAVFSVVVFL